MLIFGYINICLIIHMTSSSSWMQNVAREIKDKGNEKHRLRTDGMSEKREEVCNRFALTPMILQLHHKTSGFVSIVLTDRERERGGDAESSCCEFNIWFGFEFLSLWLMTKMII